MHIPVKWLWRGACLCFGLFNEWNPSWLFCLLSIWWRRKRLHPSYPSQKHQCPSSICGVLLVCVPAPRGGAQSCREMLKQEQKALPLKDFKACSWKREGETQRYKGHRMHWWWLDGNSTCYEWNCALVFSPWSWMSRNSGYSLFCFFFFFFFFFRCLWVVL